MEIVNIKITELKPAEYNPRQMTEKQEQDLMNSIKKFGLVDPIIVNKNKDRMNIVIGGHQRLKIAEKLEMTEVPVFYIDLTEDKEKELNLRLNKNTGQWDIELLKELDTELLLEAGFEMQELDNLFDNVLQLEDDDYKGNPEAGDDKEKIYVKAGDVYQLGEHRLMCGDSTILSDVEKLMAEEKADMIYCDPPYNIGLDYSKGANTGPKQKEKKQYRDEKSPVKDKKSDDEYRLFINDTLTNALAVAMNDIHVFYWCDEKYIGLIQDIYKDNEISNKRVCLWVKNNISLTPQIAFNKCYEPCVYGTKGKPKINENMNNLTEIMNQDIRAQGLYDDMMSYLQIWAIRRDSSLDYEHPTQKPVTLNEKPIKRCTNVGGKVIDLFGGSGSTLIACEQLKRKAFIMEQDPRFCQVIINRYEELTSNKAVKL